jgi:hypothetical protein
VLAVTPLCNFVVSVCCCVRLCACVSEFVLLMLQTCLCVRVLSELPVCLSVCVCASGVKRGQLHIDMMNTAERKPVLAGPGLHVVCRLHIPGTSRDHGRPRL